MHQLTNIKKTVKHNKLNKESLRSETRRLFYLEKILILNLKNKINKFPDKVAAEVEKSSKEVFRHFFRYKPEDVILFITKKKKLWEIKFKVLPSYSNKMNYLKYLKNNKSKYQINLREFYLENIKCVFL